MHVRGLATALIGLGSNQGDSVRIVLAAWSALGEISEVETLRLSSPYRSRPVAMDSPHWFVNAVGLLRTTLGPHALLHLLQSLERRFGRRRDLLAGGYQDRSLDLDLLLYDALFFDTPGLIIPHPRMGDRRFVLDPLLEILDGTVRSPFALPLEQWVKAHRSRLLHQEIVRCSWPESLMEAAPQP